MKSNKLVDLLVQSLPCFQLLFLHQLPVVFDFFLAHCKLFLDLWAHSADLLQSDGGIGTIPNIASRRVYFFTNNCPSLTVILWRLIVDPCVTL